MYAIDSIVKTLQGDYECYESKETFDKYGQCRHDEKPVAVFSTMKQAIAYANKRNNRNR